MKKKGIMAAALLLAGMQLALAAGAGDMAVNWLEDAITSGSLVSATMRYEHGAPTTPTPSPSPTVPSYTSAPMLSERTFAETPEPSPTPEIKEATIYGELDIDNRTSFEIEPVSLMREGLTLSLPKEGPQILIIHTHGTESYTAADGDNYVESDYARTTNCDYNMIRVGNELCAELEAQGLSVLHDRGLYDYPSYNGSYTRSGSAIESYLEKYPNIAIVIDLHRDAIGDGDVVYKTMAEIPDVVSSQIMILVGTGENGLSHPNWHENLKLALMMQEAATSKYPTLMRPLAVRQERYNQQLTDGSLLIEVGSNGNTLREALTAVDLFADAVGPSLLELVSD
ncbi:MAG: stage II sporulation protein P [Oscillospiraceae bacterium]